MLNASAFPVAALLASVSQVILEMGYSPVVVSVCSYSRHNKSKVMLEVDLVTRSVQIHQEASCVSVWKAISSKWMGTHAEKVTISSVGL